MTMPKAKVLDYSEILQAHKIHVKGENYKRLMDLFIDKDLKIPPEELIGKTIEYEWEHPYISIAHNVSLVQENNDGQNQRSN